MMKKFLLFLTVVMLVFSSFLAYACNDDTASPKGSDNTVNGNISQEDAAITHKIKYYVDGIEYRVISFKETDENIELIPAQKIGYLFLFWTDENNGIITALPSGLTEDVSLYAVFSPIKYTISFNRNGGDGTMDSIDVNYDETANLPDCSFLRRNYSFTGWATAPMGKVEYENCDSICNLTEINGAEIILYAQWKSTDITLPPVKV